MIGVTRVLDSAIAEEIKSFGETILVLQGGGALGAYQVGVFEALAEIGLEPDWVIGTSIGAINGSIIAGNAPSDRLENLNAFWDHITQFDPFKFSTSDASALALNFSTLAFGLPGFFRPNPMAMFNPFLELGPDKAGYYSTDPLRETLSDLIDFERINRGDTRLTVGAASVSDSEMHYFDSNDDAFSLDHTMASGALPPAFPPVRIKGQLYWDGGILSNTPVEYVFDARPRRNAFVISVQLWNHLGDEPQSVWQALNRQKDLQFSSRVEAHITRQRQIHRLRHIIAELAAKLPDDPEVREATSALAGHGCNTRMHLVRLLAAPLPAENHLKDVDFSPDGIRSRRDAGLRDTRKMLKQAPWRHDFDESEGLVLHDCVAGNVYEPPAPI